MNWKKLESRLLIHSAKCFAALMFLSFVRPRHIDRQELVWYALLAVSLASGIVGFEELKRGEHRRTSRLLIGSFFLWPAVISIPLGLMKLSKTTQFDFAIPYLLYSIYPLIACAFPIAFCLNRNERRPDSQPTVTNAS